MLTCSLFIAYIVLMLGDLFGFESFWGKKGELIYILVPLYIQFSTVTAVLLFTIYQNLCKNAYSTWV